MTTTEIVRHESVPSLPQKMEWVRAMASSTLLPRQYQSNPGNLLFAIEYADALGVNRMAAITSIHVIEGKPSASADLIANLVRKAGHKLRVTGDDTYAVAQLIRADDPDFTFEARWDLDKARAASLLGKGVWKSYPGAMLRSRAITEVARMGASDALFGVIYTPEELGATVDSDGDVVHHISQVQPGAGADRAREALGVRTGGGGEGSPAETSVAEGEAGSSPAGNTSPPPSPEGITPPQIRKLGVLMKEAGLTERDTALRYVADTIGRTVGSRNELTKAEASHVIDALERRQTVVGAAGEEESVEGSSSEGIVDAELVDDASQIWAQIKAVGQGIGMSESDLNEDFSQAMGGLIADEASAAELQTYLAKLQGGEAA